MAQHPDPSIESEIAARADAATASLFAAVLPALANAITGANTSTDPSAGWAPQIGMEAPFEALARLVESEPGNRMCSEPPLWIWAAGVRLSVDGDPQPMLDAWEGAGAAQILAQAHDLALAFGGAGVIMLTGQPLDRPLDPVRVSGPVRLLVAGAPDLLCEPAVTDPRSPWYGQPEWYQLQGTGYLSSPIHASHVLPFLGVRRRSMRLSMGRWHNWPGVSLIQSAWGAISQWVETCSATQAAIRRMSTILVSHPDYAAKMMADQAAFQDILRRISEQIGTGKTVHGPPGASVAVASMSLSGLGDAHQLAYARLALEQPTPLALLFSQPPPGLSTDEKSWWAGWTTRLTGMFGAWSWGTYAPNYQRLYAVMAPQVYGASPPRWQGIVPGDYRAPTDLERAELFAREADAAKTLLDAGAISVASVRVSEGRVEVIDPEARADAAPERAPTLIALEQDPEDVAEVVARVRALLPDLVSEPWPHVTLVYLGDSPTRDVRALRSVVASHAEDAPHALIPDYIAPLGDEGAIVLRLRPRGLAAFQARLLRATAPQVRAAQYPSFVPHVTLGYVSRALHEDEIEALAALDVGDEIEAGALVLRRGEDVLVRADAAESYDPPQGARDAARRALEVRAAKPASERGMTPVGLARARDLVNGRALSARTVRRMKAYFDRHQADKKGATWGDQGPGWQAWMGWGGDVGWRWATRTVEGMED